MDGAPDVLLIYADQWRWDALGCAGGVAVTPHLDALAAAGVRFPTAVVQSPVCMPSRASLLTGRLPSTLGITTMGIPVPQDVPTVATLLGSRGWRTASIGKLHLLPHANRDFSSPHPAYGFDTLVVSDEPGVYEDDYRAWVRAHDPGALEHLPVALPPAAAVWQRTMHPAGGGGDQEPAARDDYADAGVFGADAALTHSAWVATRTIEHLDALPDHLPALTIASFFSPHAPYSVPQRFYDLYERAALPLPAWDGAEQELARREGLTEERLRALRHGYLAACSEVDHHVGRLLGALDRLGRAENTLVLFVSDHGEWLGDHARLAKGYPADDPVSRVPLIARWPAVAVAGHVEHHVVELLDVLPTVLAACGVPVPGDLQGTSLLGALRGEPLEGPEAAITEHEDWTSLRTGDHHYLVHADGSEHLWDLDADPGEHADLAGAADAAGDLAHHRLLLLQRLLRARRTLARTWPY